MPDAQTLAPAIGDAEKTAAAEWFVELRDRICTAFERLEDLQLTGQDEGDAIEFQAPDGLKTFDILEVRYE